MNIDEITTVSRNAFKRLTFAKVVKLLKISEVDESVSQTSFFAEIAKNKEEISELLGLENSSIETTDLINVTTAVQLQIFKYLQKISNKKDSFAESEGNRETCCPFLKSLQSIKFSFTKAFNSSVFEIDNALFVDVIDNVEAYLFFNTNTTTSTENHYPRVIRQHASDTDLF